jgi:hypothetical protein
MSPHVEIIELDMHINESQFAQMAAATLLTMMAACGVAR